MYPLVSVIVPVYNAERFIHRCINSILSQTYQDFEVLLINDGSPDESGKICDEYAQKDKRIKVFHKENGGVTSARKYGLDDCNGEWVILLDSDDYIEPNTLELLLTYAFNFDSDLIIGYYKYVDENNNFIKIAENHILGNHSEDVLKSVLYNLCTGSLCCRLIKKTLFNNIYFPPREINMGEDTICGIQIISNAQNITICPHPIYNYVQQTNSITHNLNSNNVKHMPTFIKWIHSYIIKTRPSLKVASSVFCLQQYYTYLTHSGRYSNDFFEYIFHKDALQNISFKAKTLFKIYLILPWLGNIIKNIISLKHIIHL